MLIYNNGRFSVGALSFELPNGIGVDTGNDEICGQGFYLSAPDDSFIVQIDVKESGNNAYEEFSHILDDETSYKLIGKIVNFAVGGLEGYKAVYEDEDTLNEEYAFNLNECGDYTVLNVFVMIRKSCATYDANYKNRIVSELLSSIKASKHL